MRINGPLRKPLRFVSYYLQIKASPAVSAKFRIRIPSVSLAILLIEEIKGKLCSPKFSITQLKMTLYCTIFTLSSVFIAPARPHPPLRFHNYAFISKTKNPLPIYHFATYSFFQRPHLLYPCQRATLHRTFSSQSTSR